MRRLARDGAPLTVTLLNRRLPAAGHRLRGGSLPLGSGRRLNLQHGRLLFVNGDA